MSLSHASGALIDKLVRRERLKAINSNSHYNQIKIVPKKQSGGISGGMKKGASFINYFISVRWLSDFRVAGPFSPSSPFIYIR